MPPTANTTEDQRGFRLDIPLHALLTQPAARSVVAPVESPQRLPEAVFPQHPELLGNDGSGPPVPPKRQYKEEQITRALRGWAIPWLKSRVLPGDFHPIIAYLFTEWKCNLDCHYCGPAARASGTVPIFVPTSGIEALLTSNRTQTARDVTL